MIESEEVKHWYQPRLNGRVSSGLTAPNTDYPGFKLEKVVAGIYNREFNLWDWQEHMLV